MYFHVHTCVFLWNEPFIWNKTTIYFLPGFLAFCSSSDSHALEYTAKQINSLLMISCWPINLYRMRLNMFKSWELSLSYLSFVFVYVMEIIKLSMCCRFTCTLVSERFCNLFWLLKHCPWCLQHLLEACSAMKHLHTNIILSIFSTYFFLKYAAKFRNRFTNKKKIYTKIFSKKFYALTITIIKICNHNFVFWQNSRLSSSVWTSVMQAFCTVFLCWF